MKRAIMERLIKWRLGNKSDRENSWEEIERKKYGDSGMKINSYSPVPPLDQIHIPAARYWHARASFVITNKIAYQLERFPGVSFFKPIGPYDFVMSVNEDFFNEYQVMSSINKHLNAKAPKK